MKKEITYKQLDKQIKSIWNKCIDRYNLSFSIANIESKLTDGSIYEIKQDEKIIVFNEEKLKKNKDKIYGDIKILKLNS